MEEDGGVKSSTAHYLSSLSGLQRKQSELVSFPGVCVSLRQRILSYFHKGRVEWDHAIICDRPCSARLPVGCRFFSRYRLTMRKQRCLSWSTSALFICLETSAVKSQLTIRKQDE